MQIQGIVNGKPTTLEIYKLQTSLFRTVKQQSVLIYNEDKTQMWEETGTRNVKALQKFMGKNVIKCYACGYQNEDGKIVLIEKENNTKYHF